jgi:TPR repeat protein
MVQRFFAPLGRGVAVALAAAAAAGAEPDLASVEVALGAIEAGSIDAAAEILAPLANARDAQARLALGRLHLEGRILDARPSEGRLLVMLAATQGHPEAMAVYGDLLLAGEATVRDPAAAAQWYRDAWKAGSARGALGLGYLHRDGVGRRHDPAAAIALFEAAAERGLPEARLALAEMLIDGRGTPRNLGRAREHLLIAAGAGEGRAAYLLGSLAADADGASEEAFRWFAMAASLGDGSGGRALAESYRDGAGAPRDLVRAYAWANVAAAGGCAESAALRDAVGRELGSEGVARAEALSERIFRGEADVPGPSPGATAADPVAPPAFSVRETRARPRPRLPFL